MEKKNLKSEEIFGNKSVWKAIFSLAIPSCVTILIMVFYNLADMFFIGQLGDTAQVAAVSIVGPIFSLAAAVATMLGIGGASVIAGTAGTGQTEKAKTYASLCFYIGIILGVICMGIMLLGAKQLLSLLGASQETFKYAKEYLQVLALGAPLMILSTSLPALLRSDGAIMEGLVGNLVGTVLNIVLDPIFIFGFGLGVKGAAIATVMSNAVSTTFYIVFILRKGQVLSLSLALATKNPGVVLRIMAVGAPNGINSILAGFASTFSNNLLCSYGVSAIAAMAAGGKVAMIISMLHMGICMGAQPMLAYNYGAGNVARLKETVKKLGILTVGVGTVTTLACILSRGALIGMFLKEPSTRELGRQMVIFLTIISPILGLYYLGTNYFQATGKAMLATVMSLLRQGIILIPALYTLDKFGGVYEIGLAYTVADLLSVVIVIVVLIIQVKGLKKKFS